MCLVDKLIKRTSRNEQGFVLLTAIIGIMIVIAAGYFALTLTSKDVRISSQLVGERKALSAAESGIHVFSTRMDVTMVNEINLNAHTLDRAGIMASSANNAIDAVNDPNIRFDTAAVNYNRKGDASGYSQNEAVPGSFKALIYQTDITGRDQSYGSRKDIRVQVIYGPTPN
jgi:Tfp pilus assembly protein PilX